MIRPRGRREIPFGFTLIEMLVVTAIIGLMAAVIMTGITRGMARAREVQCVANLRQLSVAAIAYAAANRGWMPPLGGTNTPALYLADYAGAAATPIAVWRCPDDTRSGGVASYGMNRLGLTAAQALDGWPISMIANPARTVMMGDSGGAAGPVWEIRFDGSAGVREVGVEFRHGDPRASQSTPPASMAVFRQSRANLAFYDGHARGVTALSLTVTNWHGLP